MDPTALPERTATATVAAGWRGVARAQAATPITVHSVSAVAYRDAGALREGRRLVVPQEGLGEVQVLSARPTRIVVVRDLRTTFRAGGREVAAVDGVSFDVRDEEFVAIVRPSGCGESTILSMIGGPVMPVARNIALGLQYRGATRPERAGGVREAIVLAVSWR